MALVRIQKGIFKDDWKDEKKTLDSIVTLQEMFYAEYEFGELPRALKRMTKDFSNMEFFKMKTRKTKLRPIPRTITILANVTDETKRVEIVNEINELAKRKVYTKGDSGFPTFMELTTDEYPQNRFDKIDFWWNLDKDYMFFVDDEDNTHAAQLTIAFGNLAEKWKDELFPQEEKGALSNAIETIKNKFKK